MPKKADLTQSEIRRLFRYENGRLYWRERPLSDFASAREWRIINTRNAGKEAGTDRNGYKSAVVTLRPDEGGAPHRHRVRISRAVWIYFNGDIPEDKEIDHINGIRADNRIANLRPVTSQDNSRNMARMRNNKSGSTGVCYSTSKAKWRAYITVGDQQRHIGYFSTSKDASVARKFAERTLGFHENHGRDPLPPSP